MEKEIINLIEKWGELTQSNIESLEENDNRECARIVEINLRNGLKKDIEKLLKV